MLRYKEFEATKWYNKGKFELDTNDQESLPIKSNEPPTFKLNDKVILINKKEAFYEAGRFRDSVREIGEMMEVSRHDTREMDGHLCVCCFASGWYKVDCVQKIENENEATKWYNKGKFELDPESINEPKSEEDRGDYLWKIPKEVL